MKIFVLTLFFFASTFVLAQIPDGYYSSANGTGYTLKSQLHEIIDDHTVRSYSSVWDFYESYELDSYYENDGTILDIYSENPSGSDPYNYTKVTNQCGNYSGEGSCYNREHSFPKSWFNDASPMYSDVTHLLASDGYVNGQRGNHPYGEVGVSTFTSQNGSKVGSARTGLGYSGTVFEPIDEFKGDIARIYFYMATRYQDVLTNWSSPMLNGSSDQVYQNWVIDMLMDWHTNDPVSQKEIDRNNGIYIFQGNRNPFVDHPEWVNAIWGDGTIDPTPTIATTANGGGYDFGSVVAGNSSASINYKVTGTDLESDVTVSVPSPFQVSLNNSSWSGSVVVSQANAQANTSNTVYVRFSPVAANGQTYNSVVSHVSTNATTRTVSITGKEGEIGVGSGAIQLVTNSFNGDFGQTIIGQPSGVSSYAISGSDLTSPIQVTAPTQFEVSLQATSGFTSSLSVSPINGVVSATTIYVRFLPTSSGSVESTITNVSGGASQGLNVQGFGMVATSVAPKLQVKIYPNPSDDLIVLAGVDLRSDFKLFDANGKRQEVTFREGALDVAKLPTGIYYLIILSEGVRTVQKIAVSH